MSTVVQHNTAFPEDPGPIFSIQMLLVTMYTSVSQDPIFFSYFFEHMARIWCQIHIAYT